MKAIIAVVLALAGSLVTAAEEASDRPVISGSYLGISACPIKGPMVIVSNAGEVSINWSYVAMVAAKRAECGDQLWFYAVMLLAVRDRDYRDME